jgi:outer membrane protein OmpA-like peptidoglycan-associated protein
MMTFPRRPLPKAAAALPFAVLLAFPATASALDVGVKVEPGVAVPLSAPQTQRFTPGGDVSFKGYLGLGRYFDAQAGFSVLGLGAASGSMPSTIGTAWSDSLGLRFKRPHDGSLERGGFYAASPWIDADGLYVRTGGLDRFGLTFGAGVSFPLARKRNAWLGPFVRYMQIVQSEHRGFDDGDARVLLLGLTFELGTSPLAPLVLPPPPAVECPSCAPVAAMVVPVALVAPDRDQDGVPDAADNCPDVPGPFENHGCPVYKKVIVKRDKLELTEKIMFAFDKADIEVESVPLLDEVVQALKDYKGLRVRIEGHTDSQGPAEHNQTLSEERAAAVLAYVRDHGIASDRLSYKGFGSTEPTDSNKTVLGRENNRRVDFVVQFAIVDGGTP